MSKTIKAAVEPGGKIHLAYDGFVGNACFEVAGQLRERLRLLGVEVEMTKVTDVKDEVEVRRLENFQSAGTGG